MFLRATAALALISAPMIAPTAVAAQQVPDGIEVDRLGLNPGDSMVFTIRQGNDHQLLDIKHRGQAAMDDTLTKGEMRTSLWMDGDTPVLTVENMTDHHMNYSILADFDGNGGYRTVGEQMVMADGKTDYRFDAMVAEVNVGTFVPAPHGDTEHKQAGG